jgi:hypothetical protein
MFQCTSGSVHKELPMKTITLLDTTLRDGNQAEDINLSLEDKIKITLKLSDFGIPYSISRSKVN